MTHPSGSRSQAREQLFTTAGRAPGKVNRNALPIGTTTRASGGRHSRRRRAGATRPGTKRCPAPCHALHCSTAKFGSSDCAAGSQGPVGEGERRAVLTASRMGGDGLELGHQPLPARTAPACAGLSVETRRLRRQGVREHGFASVRPLSVCSSGLKFQVTAATYIVIRHWPTSASVTADDRP